MTTSLRVLTYNVQLRSWGMEVGAQGSLTPYTSVEERARTIARRILASDQDYDVVCLQEVFDEDGREILAHELGGKYRYLVQKSDDTSLTLGIPGAVAGSLLQVVAPAAALLTGLAGVNLGSLLSIKFEDSGLMLFSRLPFDTMPTPPDLLAALAARGINLPAVPAVAFATYVAAAGDDAAAAKGVLYARLMRYNGAPLHLLTSHTQADATGKAEAHKGTRVAQLAQAYELLEHMAGEVAEAEVLFVGDLNVDGMCHPVNGYRREWQELFDSLGASHYTDDLLDAWVREQCPGDPGPGRTPLPTTFDRGMTAQGQRLDYALRSRGPSRDRMLLQHMCVAYEIAQDPAAPTAYTSDHLPVRIDLDIELPHASVLTAEPVPVTVDAPDQILTGLLTEGHMHWYRIDERGGYRIWLTEGYEQLRVDVYTADNLSVPVKPFTTLDDGAAQDHPGQTRFALPSAPFYLRVHLARRRGEIPYELRIHRYTGAGRAEAIPLLRGVPQLGFTKINGPHSTDDPATPWSEHDAVWFLAALDTDPDGSLEVSSTVTVEDPATRAFGALLLGNPPGGAPTLVEEAPAGAVVTITGTYREPLTGYVLVRREDPTFTAREFTVTLRSSISYLYGNPTAPHSRARELAQLFCVDETGGLAGSEWGSDDIQVNVTANGIVRVHIPNSDYLEFDDDSRRNLPAIDAVRYTGSVEVELVELDDFSPVDRASVSIPQFDALGPDARVIEGNPSGVVGNYAIVFDRADDEDDDDDGVYELTLTVSPEPPKQV